MDIIAAYPDGTEIGFVRECIKIDMDTGDTNDFELTVAERDYSDKYQMKNLIYAPGSEWGGIISDIKTDSSAGTIKLLGDTWRGMMTRKVIEPPAGSAYLTVEGDLGTVLEQVITDKFSGLISADNALTGVNVKYTFDRYTDMLSGLTKLLKGVDMRLDIRWSDERGCVVVKGVPAADYSDDIELNQDMRINFTTRSCKRGINHLICLGSGELENRQVAHLYMQPDGSVSGETRYYTGIDERTAVYDYSNAESIEELVNGGVERLRELADYNELSMNAEDIDAEIGDIIGGRDRITGLSMKKPITGRILRISGVKESIEYRIGD